MSKYFTCDPTSLCDGGTCCKSPETEPSLSIGDFLRLSAKTGEPIEHIWRTKGNISMSQFDDMPRGMFMLWTGLLHDPCPYLKDMKCSVYDHRPLGCGSFPGILMERRSDELFTIYKEYRCLQEVTLRPEQQSAIHELQDIIHTEAELDIRHVWGSPQYLNLGKMQTYFQLAEQAIDIQAAKDSNAELPRTQRLLDSISRMNAMVKTPEFKKGLDVHLYCRLTAPILFTLYEEGIADRMRNLGSEAREAYSRTTERWRALRSKID